jgi:hypothetical protein
MDACNKSKGYNILMAKFSAGRSMTESPNDLGSMTSKGLFNGLASRHKPLDSAVVRVICFKLLSITIMYHQVEFVC